MPQLFFPFSIAYFFCSALGAVLEFIEITEQRKTTLMAGKIIINTELCKGCGLCVTACPNQCIAISCTANSMGYFPAEFNEINCTGCAQCALMCPDVAIEVFRQDVEKSAPSKPSKKTVKNAK